MPESKLTPEDWRLLKDNEQSGTIVYARTCLVENVLELLEALEMLLDRLDEHGSIDPVREEGPIEDARNIIARARGNA